jgi:spore germination protein GerM
MVLLMAITAGCGLTVQEMKSWKDAIKEPVQKMQSTEFEEDQTPVEDSAKLTVQLYFKRKDGNGLGMEEREVKKTEGIARLTMEELLKGPHNQDLETALPSGTKLLDINIKPDGSCLVNFNSNICNVNGSKAESLAVYAVVDTLSQFPTVDDVTFLVDGEKINTLAGHIDVSQPVVADYKLSEGNP